MLSVLRWTSLFICPFFQIDVWKQKLKIWVNFLAHIRAFLSLVGRIRGWSQLAEALCLILLVSSISIDNHYNPHRAVHSPRHSLREKSSQSEMILLFYQSEIKKSSPMGIKDLNTDLINLIKLAKWTDIPVEMRFDDPSGTFLAINAYFVIPHTLIRWCLLLKN